MMLNVSGFSTPSRDDDNLDLGSARPFQQVGDFGGVQIVGLLVVDFDDHVARPNACLIGRRTGKGRESRWSCRCAAAPVMPTP